ncbi:intraflagellar transport-associated protein isoform X2 [Panthera tigris]|uniref:intraflagellar transport-associated protein isoform X2 n=1 Tax=Panthera tigris TaxID=9694 RepID=UPI001C6F7235|nr:intraflagellar transport-associated protein isoform X2 [Panthera tigris]XP_042814986.1 intraflagellar transport-associated protein isoform X2 [Panthera tigris]
MPARISELEIMDEDRLTEEVLDKFVNCHEQTYEEFLSTFPHLSKEDNVTKRGAFGTDSSENVFPSEEEQIVMDEGQKVGSTFQGDLSRAGKVKVDNFLDLEDLDIDEETQPQMSKESEILPECYGMKSASHFLSLHPLGKYGEMRQRFAAASRRSGGGRPHTCSTLHSFRGPALHP